jgi:hypothetical protein
LFWSFSHTIVTAELCLSSTFPVGISANGFILLHFCGDRHSAQCQARYWIVQWVTPWNALAYNISHIMLTSANSAPRIIFEPPGMPKSCSIVWPTNSIYFFIAIQLNHSLLQVRILAQGAVQDILGDYYISNVSFEQSYM